VFATATLDRATSSDVYLVRSFKKEHNLTKSVPSQWSLEDSYAYCRKLAKRAATNFYVSFLALPSQQRRAMQVLYAFMRLSDDLGDTPGVSRDQRAVNLNDWRCSLAAALQDEQYDHAVFPALAQIVREYEIPHQYLFDVIDGVCMDLDFTGFETFENLQNYCYHVAGAVGLCCIHIWGFNDEEALDSAIDCGLAFQLTNILRDLGEDAAMGRVYLPREELKRFGYSAGDIASSCRDRRFRQLMDFEVGRTEEYYRKAESLFEYLAPAGKPILRAMLNVYDGILKEIKRRDYDVYSRRVRLPKWRKLLIAGHALLARKNAVSSVGKPSG
jgi:15-cis-phytoene synthase